ncbi:MAG: flavodoxin [Tenuifilaceae bacterium]
MKIGIFYGPIGGATERIAKMIQSEFGASNADLIPVNAAKAEDVEKYKYVIFGSSTIGNETWDARRPKPDWDNFRSELDRINYKDKIFALYGLGDHISYARFFVDSMGIIAKRMLSNDAKIVGTCDPKEYEFEHSEALIDGRFIGLPIDEEFESEKTPQRVKNWVNVLKRDFL